VYFDFAKNYIYIHIFKYISTHTYIYIHIYIYLYIHIHIYIYTYIHIYTYTYISMFHMSLGDSEWDILAKADYTKIVQLPQTE
jgi:hypothetical protein